MVEQTRFSSELDRVAEHLEQMWDRLVPRGSGAAGGPRYAPTVIEPATDVYQTQETIVVLMEIAGMRDQEVEIQLDGRHMTVRGVKLDRRAALPGCSYSVVEIPYGPFMRTLVLPADVDQARVSVRYDDGLLQITLGKRAHEPHHRVRITVR
jgi:HSP20 family protein